MLLRPLTENVAHDWKAKEELPLHMQKALSHLGRRFAYFHCVEWGGWVSYSCMVCGNCRGNAWSYVSCPVQVKSVCDMFAE